MTWDCVVMTVEMDRKLFHQNYQTVAGGDLYAQESGFAVVILHAYSGSLVPPQKSVANSCHVLTYDTWCHSGDNGSRVAEECR